MTAPILVLIAEAIYEAHMNGIPVRRIYLGPVKQRELEKELERNVIGFEFMGYKVVASKKPGIQVGR